MAITNSVLPLVIERASNVWPDNMSEKDFVPQFETLRAIGEQQTAQIQYTNLPDGVDSRIAWINNCDLTVDTLVTTDCTFSGQEADTYQKDLVIDQAKETKFSVKIDEWRDNLFGFADAVAVNLNKTMVVQLEAVAAYSVAVIEANLGVNVFDARGAWTISSTDTEIPAAEWEKTALMGRLRAAASMNRINNPYLLSGFNLYDLVYQARTSAGNGEGKGDMMRIGEMPVYLDLFTVDQVNNPAYRTYLIERGALAFLSKGYYPETPEVLNGNYKRFSIRNRFFPALVHDVEVYTDCVSGVWKENYKVIPRYKIEVNPTGCTGTRTGLLRFTNPGGI